MSVLLPLFVRLPLPLMSARESVFVWLKTSAPLLLMLPLPRLAELPVPTLSVEPTPMVVAPPMEFVMSSVRLPVPKTVRVFVTPEILPTPVVAVKT